MGCKANAFYEQIADNRSCTNIKTHNDPSNLGVKLK